MYIANHTFSRPVCKIDKLPDLKLDMNVLNIDMKDLKKQLAQVEEQHHQSFTMPITESIVLSEFVHGHLATDLNSFMELLEEDLMALAKKK